MDRGLAARSFGAQVINIDGQDGGGHWWAAGTPPVLGTVSVLADLSAQEANVDRGLTARSLGAQVIDIDGQDVVRTGGGGDAALPGNGQRPR